jgi:hypothetical protein
MGTDVALEPLDGTSILDTRFLRMLMLGVPKVGKTSSILLTCPKPAYVINSDRKDSLNAATDLMLEQGVPIKGKFAHNFVVNDETMEKAIKLARTLVRESGYKTIVWDTISGFCPHLVAQCIKSTLTKDNKENGLRYWWEFRKRIINFTERLLLIDAHVIVASHWEDFSTKVEDDDSPFENKIAKSGEGIVPLIPGKARLSIGKLFEDVVFMEKTKDGKRVYTTEIDGVWGPGTSSLPGVKQVPADIGAFIKAKEERVKKLRAGLRSSSR